MRKIISFIDFESKSHELKQICRITIVLILVSSCMVNPKNQETIDLILNPKKGSIYVINTNMNVALDMKQPININLDFFIKSKFDSVREDGKLAITSEISRIKSILSSSVFHRSYDTEHPV